MARGKQDKSQASLRKEWLIIAAAMAGLLGENEKALGYLDEVPQARYQPADLEGEDLEGMIDYFDKLAEEMRGRISESP